MKILLTSLFLGLSLSAMAQQSRRSSLRTSIDDDDKTMTISVDGTVNDREISYNRRFKVSGMSGSEKDALKNRVFDSLGVGEPPKPPMPAAAPKPPTPPAPSGFSSTKSDDETVTFVCPTCTGRMRLEVLGENFSLTRETDSKKDKANPFPMTTTMRPGKYEYIYWQNGVQQMHLLFEVKAGQKNEVTVK
jgi:hypothetical protein